MGTHGCTAQKAAQSHPDHITTHFPAWSWLSAPSAASPCSDGGVTVLSIASTMSGAGGATGDVYVSTNPPEWCVVFPPCVLGGAMLIDVEVPPDIATSAPDCCCCATAAGGNARVMGCTITFTTSWIAFLSCSFATSSTLPSANRCGLTCSMMLTMLCMRSRSTSGVPRRAAAVSSATSPMDRINAPRRSSISLHDGHTYTRTRTRTHTHQLNAAQAMLGNTTQRRTHEMASKHSLISRSKPSRRDTIMCSP